MSHTPSVVARILAGAGAGAVATVPMTVLMLGAKRLGLMSAPEPPVEITDKVVGEVADQHPRSRVPAAIAHLAFGSGAGALFALVRRGRRGSVGLGVTYGLSIWLVSYAGWLPALDLMPRPADDARGRPATMIAAHVVFGAALGAAVDAITRRSTRRSTR